MDKEALKKRIFAEGEKAKGGVNRFLEEEKQELSHQLEGRSERSQNPIRETELLQNSEQLQNLSLLQNAERKAEQPQSILQKTEKPGLSFKERKARRCRFFKTAKEKTEAFIEKAAAHAEERGGRGLPERKFIALKKRKKVLHAFVIPCYGESSYLEEIGRAHV